MTFTLGVAVDVENDKLLELLRGNPHFEVADNDHDDEHDEHDDEHDDPDEHRDDDAPPRRSHRIPRKKK